MPFIHVDLQGKQWVNANLYDGDKLLSRGYETFIYTEDTCHRLHFVSTSLGRDYMPQDHDNEENFFTDFYVSDEGYGHGSLNIDLPLTGVLTITYPSGEHGALVDMPSYSVQELSEEEYANMVETHKSHSEVQGDVTIAEVLLCFFLGGLGAHKFYRGKIGMGILYIFTGGLFGIGVLIDFFKLIIGLLKK